MGIQATMFIGDKQGATSVATDTAAVVFPPLEAVSIAVILAPADNHRLLEVYNRVRKLLDYARDNNLFVGAGAIAIITSLSGIYRTEAIASNVVTGDIAIMIQGAIKNRGYTNIIDAAHRQLLNAMREEGSLVSQGVPLP